MPALDRQSSAASTSTPQAATPQTSGIPTGAAALEVAVPQALLSFVGVAGKHRGSLKLNLRGSASRAPMTIYLSPRASRPTTALRGLDGRPRPGVRSDHRSAMFNLRIGRPSAAAAAARGSVLSYRPSCTTVRNRGRNTVSTSWCTFSVPAAHQPWVQLCSQAPYAPNRYEAY